LMNVGVTVLPDKNAATLLKQAWTRRQSSVRKSGDSRKVIEAAKLFADDIRSLMGPKSDLTSLNNKRQDLVTDWLAAQTNDRVPDPDGSGRMVTFGGIKLPGGLRMAESQEIINNANTSAAGPQIQAVAKAMRDGFVALTEEAVASGVIPRYQANAWYVEEPFYVNTQGQSDDTTDTNFLERGFKGFMEVAEGSHHLGNSNDIYSNLRIRSDKLAHIIENQKVGMAMLDAKNAGSKLFAETTAQMRSADGAKTITRVTLPGSDVRFVMPTTPELNKALGKHPNAMAPELSRKITRGTGVFGRLVTHANPAFGAINLLREIPTRAFNLVGRRDELVNAAGKRVSLTATRARLFTQAVNPVTWYEAIRYGFGKEYTGALQEFKATGGFQTFSDRLSTEDQIIRSLDAKTANWVKKSPGAVMQFIKNWNNVFEATAVLSSYKALRAGGIEPQQAGFVTLDMMNFRNSGEWTPTWVKPLFTFANATAQDALQTKRAFYHRGKVNGRAILEVGALAAVAAMLYGMTREADDDDELGGKQLDSQPAGDVYRNINIPNGDGTYTKLPIGFGAFQTAWQMGVAIQKHTLGLLTEGEMFADIASGFVKNFSITGGSEISLGKDPAGWFSQTVTPSLLKPIVSVYSNKNFAGAPIEGPIRKDKYASEQGKLSTPEAYKTVATTMRETIGWDMSPEKWRVGIEGYALGPFAAMLDYFVDITGDREGKGLRTDATISGIDRALGVNRFLSRTSANSSLQGV
jgi:hypothetical protein